MRSVKIIFEILVLILAALFAFWLILPRGYILLKILEKKGFSIYPETIKEGLFSTSFYRVHLSIKGFRITIPEARLNWRGLEVPCDGGHLKILYLPPEDLRFEFRDFRGRCAGREDFEKISGTLIYHPSRGFSGRLRVSGFRSPEGSTTIFLDFSGQEVLLRSPRFTRRVPFKFSLREGQGRGLFQRSQN